MSKDKGNGKGRISEAKQNVKRVASKTTGNESMKQQNKMEKDAGTVHAADREIKGASKKGA